MTKLLTTLLLSVALLGAPPLVSAQPFLGGGGPGLGGGPPDLGFSPLAILQNVFPPSLIMRHETEIGLTDAQRETITKEMEDAQKSLVSLQWDVQRQSQKLTQLLAPAKIDEAAALQQADQAMRAEEKLKQAHLALLIRIKNTLTTAQQEKLRKLRPAPGPFPPDPR